MIARDPTTSKIFLIKITAASIKTAVELTSVLSLSPWTPTNPVLNFVTPLTSSQRDLRKKWNHTSSPYAAENWPGPLPLWLELALHCSSACRRYNEYQSTHSVIDMIKVSCLPYWHQTRKVKSTSSWLAEPYLSGILSSKRHFHKWRWIPHIPIMQRCRVFWLQFMWVQLFRGHSRIKKTFFLLQRKLDVL